MPSEKPHETTQTPKSKPPNPRSKNLGLKVTEEMLERIKKARAQDFVDGTDKSKTQEQWLVGFLERYLPVHEAAQRSRKP